VATTSWGEWSRSAWTRHLPDAADPFAYVAGLGEGTIHGLAHATAMSDPDRPAVDIGGAELTHGELDVTAARVSGWLSKRIAPGDRVLLAGASSFDWMAGYLGTLRAGGVAVLANPAYTKTELDQLIGAAEPAIVFTEQDSAPFSGEPEPWIDRGAPDSMALLTFTSGTTGAPKGVPLTHRQLLTSIRGAMAAWRWSKDEVLVHALPVFHQHGLGGVHATLIAGSRLHLLPHFTPEELIGTIESANATVVFAVPTMYQRLGAREPSRNRLRLCVCGSSALSRAVAEGARHVLGQVPLVRYGTTETGLDTSHVYADSRDLDLAETVGLPLPGVEVRLAEDGEIQVRGPQVFGGYWRSQEETQLAFTADGWFRTGDIGRIEEASGHLVIQGRIKEIIITGGLKVHPREVELALEKHPNVAEAAVAGVSSETWGEQVTAWVVIKPETAFDEAGLVEHARSLLAPYKCPKQVFRLDALPRNAVGKIERRKLEAPQAADRKEG